MEGLPVVGGHEGAGVVVKVGKDVHSVAEGDHVVLSFIPACGRCPSCATGHQNLCDEGADLTVGLQRDGTSRHHVGGDDARLMCVLGTFSPYTVTRESSVVRIDDDIPLDKAALVGCGVSTGWGTAVYGAGVRPVTPSWCWASAASGPTRCRGPAWPVRPRSSRWTPRGSTGSRRSASVRRTRSPTPLRRRALSWT